MICVIVIFGIIIIIIIIIESVKTTSIQNDSTEVLCRQ